MKKTNNQLKTLLILMVFLCAACQDGEQAADPSGSTTSATEKPNIIYILADDLGYGELGSYGQEKIETPNLDALAARGMRFTQHYSGAPVCAPARCVLMTGQHGGHAYVRGNDEWGERGKVWDYQSMFDDSFLEGQRPLPDSIVTVAELLQSAGYTTGAVGKWGLGAPTTEGVPNNQGFDFFFGYNCQRQAHTFYPMHLWKNEERVMLNNKFVDLHANLPEGADPNDPASYADFQLNDYAPDLIQQEALQFLERNQNEPFFLYYASIIPHLPLQAPQEWVAHYQEKFGSEEPFTGNSYFPNRTPRATYAAMISYLDFQVGELIDKLKELGKYENTLILFSSDNGPSYVAGVDDVFFNSAGPFKEGSGNTKGYVREGGIRVPMIASWPGHIEPGSVSKHISAFYDVLPTLCEAAGIEQPDNIDGISFLPTLLGREQAGHDYLYWEFPAYSGQQAVRMGQWKAIRMGILNGKTETKLYNLETDTMEENNVADAYPEILSKMEAIMAEAHRPAALDRFKMEPLGDVKAAYLEARNRINNRLKEPQKWNLSEGYFTLSNQTAVQGQELAPAALKLLEERLQQTGGYQLKRIDKDRKNTIVFKHAGQLAAGAYRLHCDEEQILIEASETSGFQNGVQTLLKIMDDLIWQDKEMHNPTWTIAAVDIEGQTDISKSSL